jgi:hypothetical protein
MRIDVTDEAIREHARRLLEAGAVPRSELALAFAETSAATAEVLVGGTSVLPADARRHRAPRRRRCTSTSSASSRASSATSSPRRWSRRRARASGAARRRQPRLGPGQGSARALRAARRGRASRSASTARRSCALHVGAARRAAPRAGTSAPARPHRPPQGRRRRRRIGWVGGAGIEDHFNDGRFHDLFVRVTGPVVAQLQLVFVASFRWLGGDGPRDELDASFPARRRRDPIPAVVLHNAPGRYRPITDGDRATASTSASRRSTSSTRTSPTAG